MNRIRRFSLSGFRPAAMALAAVSCLSFAEPTVADPTRFDFTLSSMEFWTSYPLFDGGGFFVVSDPIPASGRIVLVASDLGGTAGYAVGYPAPFGYAYGNTFEYLVGEPPVGYAVTRTPHEDALITFQDGVAVGISYHESHSCDTGHHCQPAFTTAGSMYMSGTDYVFFAGPFAAVTGGPITIAREVPEPGTQALLLAGLLLLMASVGHLRRLVPRTRRLERKFP